MKPALIRPGGHFLPIGEGKEFAHFFTSKRSNLYDMTVTWIRYVDSDQTSFFPKRIFFEGRVGPSETNNDY